MKRLLFLALFLTLALSISQTSTCQIQNCQVCSKGGICIMCDTGYNLQINKETQTIQCSYNQNLVLIDYNQVGANPNCTAAIPFCTLCVTPNFCAQCGNGYSLNASGTACLVTNCSNNVDNCFLCSSSTTCQICQNGYTLFGNSCIQCTVTGCQSCTSTNICQNCYPGYLLNTGNGTCTPTGCMYPCATCMNGLCTGCLKPFTLVPNDNGTCFTCSVSNCNQCGWTSRNICISCNLGYTLNIPYNTTCSANCNSPLCMQCSSSNPAICSTCTKGYAIFNLTSGVCSKCNGVPICTSCTNENLNLCTSCTQGYYLNSTNQCQQCPGSNCVKCGPASSGNNTLVCTVYQNGFLTFTSYITTSNVTYPYVCDPGCASCAQNYPASCLQCSPGFYLISSNNAVQCAPCNSNCLTCIYVNNSGIQCLSCFSNAFLTSNGTCLTCSPASNCLTCFSTNTSNCLSCPFGYALTWSNGLQVCIVQCPQSCLTCFNATGTFQGGLNPNNISCSSCMSGYGLTVTGVCLPCLANCRVCSGQFQQICNQCGSGYFLNSEFQCQACTAGCSECNYIGCFQCAPNFNLVIQNNQAVCSMACQIPCASCLFNQPSQCTSCILGYTLSNITNYTCVYVQNCSNTTCEYCALGQILVNGQCQTCDHVGNCSRCSIINTSQCVVCNQGFYVNSSFLCAPCPTGCLTCSGPNICLSCQYNYTQNMILSISYTTGNQVTCLPCSPPCAQCLQNPQICTTCIEGFTFNGFNCLSQFFYQFTINLNVNQQFFFNNYQAFLAQFGYAMQTNSYRILNLNSINTNNYNTTTVSITISSQQTDNSQNAALEYHNLEFALYTGPYFAGMPVESSQLSLPYGESVPSITNYTPMICCIVIPLSITILAGLGYFYFSRNDMDLPGATSYKGEAAKAVEDIEMKDM